MREMSIKEMREVNGGLVIGSLAGFAGLVVGVSVVCVGVVVYYVDKLKKFLNW